MNDKKQENNPLEEIITAEDMVELKRDMQSAKTIEWLHKNQQQLIAGAIVFVLVLVGFSLWKEQQLAQKNSAALLYMKATNTADAVQRNALLESVVKDYGNTGYATLARLQQAASDDSAVKTAALEMLLASQGAPELVWQARLDLAELYITENKPDEARKLLQAPSGKSYEQARYYLLSRTAANDAEKAEFIQKSLDAESNDNNLVAKLESELALLRAAK